MVDKTVAPPFVSRQTHNLCTALVTWYTLGSIVGVEWEEGKRGKFETYSLGRQMVGSKVIYLRLNEIVQLL